MAYLWALLYFIHKTGSLRQVTVPIRFLLIGGLQNFGVTF